MSRLINNILKDIKVELLDEFDQNLERKAFFNHQWDDVKLPNRRGSLMQRSGNGLRKSYSAEIHALSVRFSSSKPYAGIHNNGGKIKVTAKMKAYFWARYYQAAGEILYSVKQKAAIKTKKSIRLTQEAEYWRGLALKKAGSYIIMPKRQVIGAHPVVDKAINDIIKTNISDYLDKKMKGFTKK